MFAKVSWLQSTMLRLPYKYGFLLIFICSLFIISNKVRFISRLRKTAVFNLYTWQTGYGFNVCKIKTFFHLNKQITMFCYILRTNINLFQFTLSKFIYFFKFHLVLNSFLRCQTDKFLTVCMFEKSFGYSDGRIARFGYIFFVRVRWYL